MENLYVKAILWKTCLSSYEEYNNALDKKFLNASNNNLLLELEALSSDCDATFEILSRYFDYECNDFNMDLFGKLLFSNLEYTYKTNTIPFKEFAEKCYQLWQLLPKSISTEEPFLTLSYADDPISYGDKKRSRKIYEELFDYYKKNKS